VDRHPRWPATDRAADPKGGRDALDGIEQRTDRTTVKARVRAAPNEGAANAAVVKLLAKSTGVATRDVSLAAGATSRPNG